MTVILQRMALWMNPQEIISVGKFWLWMTVFSACLFTSCGETNRTPSESISSRPEAEAVPVHYDRETLRGEPVEEEAPLDPDWFEEFPDSDESDLERFEEHEETLPDLFEEVRKPEAEGKRIQAKPDSRTDVALRQSSASEAVKEGQAPPLAPPPSSPKQSVAISDSEAAWKAQFEAIGDPDDFEFDSPDDFE